jgi:hypothetical protein
MTGHALNILFLLQLLVVSAIVVPSRGVSLSRPTAQVSVRTDRGVQLAAAVLRPVISALPATSRS